MVFDEISSAAKYGILYFSSDDDNVIAHEPVTAFDEPESAFTLPYSTFAND
jgi:hypothetical protein